VKEQGKISSLKWPEKNEGMNEERKDGRMEKGGREGERKKNNGKCG